MDRLRFTKSRLNHLEEELMTHSNDNSLFMNIKGIDKVEARWFNLVRGTAYMQHPVSLARAKQFLASVQHHLH